MGDKGSLHKKGWDGEYRPVEGLLGPKEGEIKHSVWTGERVPARNLLGDQKRAADGSPLYEAADGPAPEDALAGALAGGVIVVILGALVAAAAVALAVALVVARRLWTNLRSDIEAHRLSLGTVGWGSALGYGVFFIIAFLAGPRTLGGMRPLLWTVSDTFFLVAFAIVMTVGLAEAARRIRQSLRDHEPADGLWRWLAGAVAAVLFLFYFAATAGQYMRGREWLAWLVVVPLAAGQAAAFAWGWRGRPPLIAPLRRYLGAATASRQPPTRSGFGAAPSARDTDRAVPVDERD